MICSARSRGLCHKILKRQRFGAASDTLCHFIDYHHRSLMGRIGPRFLRGSMSISGVIASISVGGHVAILRSRRPRYAPLLQNGIAQQPDRRFSVAIIDDRASAGCCYHRRKLTIRSRKKAVKIRLSLTPWTKMLVGAMAGLPGIGNLPKISKTQLLQCLASGRDRG